MDEKKTIDLTIEELEERIAPGIAPGLAIAAAGVPPDGPGASFDHFNKEVAGPNWLGKASGQF